MKRWLLQYNWLLNCKILYLSHSQSATNFHYSLYSQLLRYIHNDKTQHTEFNHNQSSHFLDISEKNHVVLNSFISYSLKSLKNLWHQQCNNYDLGDSITKSFITTESEPLGLVEQSNWQVPLFTDLIVFEPNTNHRFKYHS